MKFQLFSMNCSNQDCGCKDILSFSKNIDCPSCGRQVITMSDSITQKVENSLIESFTGKNNILIGVLISLAYIEKEEVLASFNDYEGLSLNNKHSEKTNTFLNLLGFDSVFRLYDLLESINLHELLIRQPLLNSIKRTFCYDNDSAIFEDGIISIENSKIVYDWIVDNFQYAKYIVNK